MKALVTGATGFIGSHLVEELLKEGFEVVVTARETSNLSYLPCEKIEVKYCDLCLPELLMDQLADLDYIFHVAGLTKTRDPRKYFKVNAESTAQLLALCAKECKKLKRFVYMGSMAAVGPSYGALLTEESEPRPVTYYGQSKLEGERFAKSFMGLLPITIIIPPLVYGPRETDIFTYFKLLNRGIKFYIGNPDRKIAFIYVKDLTRAVIHAVKHKKAIGETYFITGDQLPTLGEFADTIAKVATKKCLKIRLPKAILYPAALVNTTTSFILRKPALINFQKIKELAGEWECSSEKIKRELDFKVKYSLEEGLRETWEWYKNEGWL